MRAILLNGLFNMSGNEDTGDAAESGARTSLVEGTQHYGLHACKAMNGWHVKMLYFNAWKCHNEK
jgi:hypothetical protein